MNPYLALVAIGLVLVNLIILAALSPHLRVSRRSEVPAATTEIGAIPAPAIGIATSAWQVAGLNFVVGVGLTIGNLIWFTLMGTRVPNQMLGRVSSLDLMISFSLTPLSNGLTGPVAAVFGVSRTLLAAGLLGTVVTVATLFVPGVRDAETIRQLVVGIGAPINILAVAGTPAVAELEKLGVARVSIGSGAMRASLALVREVARELKSRGTYSAFTTNAYPYDEMNELMR